MQFQNSKKIILVSMVSIRKLLNPSRRLLNPRVFIGLLGLALMLAVLSCEKKSEFFTDDNVVAQFVNGVITTDQLTAYISKIGPKCHTPAMSCHGNNAATSGCGSDETCDMHDSQMEDEYQRMRMSDAEHSEHGQNVSNVSSESLHEVSAERSEHTGSSGAQMGQTGMDCCGGQHGGEHSGCCGGSEEALKEQSCEEHENCCMQHYDLKAEDYQELVKAMVLEQMLQEYIRENKIGQEEDTQDLIKYVTENVYVTDTHLEMEEGMKPAESEIREYYEENKEKFGLRSLSEVRDDIVKILKKKMHHEYMPKYLAELKRNAFVKKDLELIKPQEPSESELRRFYRESVREVTAERSEHRSEYEEPEKIKVRQILTYSRQEAERAQSQLRSGVPFATVAERYSEGPFAQEGGEAPSYIKKGDRSKIFEENVFNLRKGDTSILFEENSNFYIVQVIEKHDRRIKDFDEVADSIRESLMAEKEKELFEDNKKRTLFTVNNRSYTVEEFKRRYDNLPIGSRSQFSGFSGNEKLIDRMIEYELLVDDARRKMFDLKNKETIQEITNSILQGSFYEKEVIGKIGIKDISDEEARKYYTENKKRFTQPPRAKVSYIRIPASESWGPNATPNESEIKAAKRKADEAYAMIKNGDEFDVVVRKYSADDWSGRKMDMYEEKDMQLVTLTEVRMHPLHEVVFAMKEGEVSKPFEFQNNYYIFKVWEKSGKGYVAFDNVKEAIKRALVIRKRKELAETLKDELMEKSQLVLNERALKAMAKKQAEKKTQTEVTHAGHSG